MQTPPSGPPPEISDLARQRDEARARRDFETADSLKAQIEAAGWRVVDRTRKSSIVPAAPPDLAVEGEIRYGSAAAVPSRLADPPDAPWTVIVPVSEDAGRASRLLSGLRMHAPSGTQVVIVANDPDDRQASALAPGSPDLEPIGGREPEVLRTSARIGYASALNIALRRASGELVVLADGSAIPRGDSFTEPARCLADPNVAVAGAFGVVSGEPGRLQPASLEPSDDSETHALLAGWLAFRRADLAILGPIDERFVIPAWLDVWWSLRLRTGADIAEPESDPGAESQPEAEAEPQADPEAADAAPQLELPPPRRAVRLDLPLDCEAIPWPPDRSRLARRNMYRVLDRFGWRGDLFERD